MSTLSFEPTNLEREISMKGLTPEQFAVAAEVSAPTIYRALKGRILKPGPFTRILKTLGSLPSLDVPADLVKAS